MQLSVATNFQDDLVDGLKGYPVLELYGKLREDAVGGGRARYQLAPVTREQVIHHIARARKAGIGFNYLLNAACLENREMTRPGQRELERLLDWIAGAGATAVTVASPYLLRFVKARHPELQVRISLFAGVDRVRKAQMWEEMGADCIVLDSLLVNREFATLRRIREGVSCDLELLVNNNCLQGCALAPTHMNCMAHTTRSSDRNGGFFIDWCFLRCTAMKMQDPMNYLRSEWIRPEDLHLYEELGYERFKIVERDIPTPFLLQRVEAYTQRHWEGNLLELIQPFGFKGVKEDQRYYRRGLSLFRSMFRPRLVNPLRLRVLKELAERRGMLHRVEGKAPVYLDNQALDGFMERFRTTGCRDQDCESCGWCQRWAEKALRVDPVHREEVLGIYDEVFDQLENGGMWHYFHN